MSPHASELTTAQLLTRARAAVACGDHLGAIAAALVVIAEAQVGGPGFVWPPEEVPF